MQILAGRLLLSATDLVNFFGCRHASYLDLRDLTDPVEMPERDVATITQIRAFLIEQGIAVRAGARALRKSLFAILENRKDEISPRMAKLICGLYEDWCCLDERIDTVTGEIEQLSRIEPKCRRLMSVPGIGP